MWTMFKEKRERDILLSWKLVDEAGITGIPSLSELFKELNAKVRIRIEEYDDQIGYHQARIEYWRNLHNGEDPSRLAPRQGRKMLF